MTPIVDFDFLRMQVDFDFLRMQWENDYLLGIPTCEPKKNTMELSLSKSELFFICQLIANYKLGYVYKLNAHVLLDDSEIESLHRMLWSAYAN